jgi:hypothetical protein
MNATLKRIQNPEVSFNVEIKENRPHEIIVENEKGEGFRIQLQADGSFEVTAQSSLNIGLNSGNCFSFKAKNRTTSGF